MAGKQELSRMQENLECSICMDTFKVPKLLPKCGHTFCEECIRAHINGSQLYGTGSFRCPMCNKEYPGDTFLADNWSLNSILDNIEESSIIETDNTAHTFSCINCAKEAVYLCEDCCDLLCVACHIKHTVRPELSDHHIVILETEDSDKYNQICQMHYSVCDNHSGVFKKQYCMVCNVAVCDKCVLSPDHRKHTKDVVSLSERLSEVKEICEENLSTHRIRLEAELCGLVEKFKQFEEKRQLLLARLRENMENIEQEITRYFAEQQSYVSPLEQDIQSGLERNNALSEELKTIQQLPIEDAIQSLEQLKGKTTAVYSDNVDKDILNIALMASDFDRDFVEGYLVRPNCESPQTTDTVDSENFVSEEETLRHLETKLLLLGLFILVLFLGSWWMMSKQTFFGQVLYSFICQVIVSLVLLHLDYSAIHASNWKSSWKVYCMYVGSLLGLGVMNMMLGYSFAMLGYQ